MKRWLFVPVLLVAALLTIAPVRAVAGTPGSGTVPPSSTPASGPVASNDLLPSDVDNCVGTVERANCGSKARADGHTYLVFGVLAVGMAFIGWRISRGVRARDAARRTAG